MKNYVKPMVVANEGLAESVYMASGAQVGPDCYTVTYNMHQRPQNGRGDYRIQFTAGHNATDGHHAGAQWLTIDFNQPVVYKESNGRCIGGDGTATIVIEFNYHNNANDNIGLGDVVVESDAGLAVNSASMSCNYDCGQH